MTDEPFTIELKSSGVSIPLDDSALPKVQGGGPEPVDPVPHPNGTFLERNKTWLAVGGAVLACLLFALTLYLILHDPSKSQAEKLLIRPAGGVDNISSHVADSPGIDQLTRAGRRASSHQSIVDRAELATQEIGNDEVRVATLELLTAEDNLLSTYGRLQSLSLGGTTRAREIAADASDAVREVKTAVSHLEALGLDETLSPYPNEQILNRAVDNLRELLNSR